MEDKILSLFLFSNRLRFNEIEKSLGVRSNKLVYHIKKLVKEGMLKKEGNFYLLSENYEHLIPYMSNKNAILPVLLIHIGNRNKCFLYKRDKRPYNNRLSLPGGRILIGENIQRAVKRIMGEKYNLDAKLKKINSVSLEFVRNKDKVVHSFLLIFASAESNDEIGLTDVNKNKDKIIASDFNLIKSKLNEEIKISEINSLV